jgi:hypothetical protein
MTDQPHRVGFFDAPDRPVEGCTIYVREEAMTSRIPALWRKMFAAHRAARHQPSKAKNFYRDGLVAAYAVVTEQTEEAVNEALDKELLADRERRAARQH